MKTTTPPPAKVWIPPSARGKPKWKCELCGMTFLESERIQRETHAARCAEVHRDALRAHIDAKEPPGFFKPFDPEYYEFVRTGGRPGGATEDHTR